MHSPPCRACPPKPWRRRNELAGVSPVIARLTGTVWAGRHELLLAGQKSGVVYALDPERVAAMMKYNEALSEAGILIALDGLHLFDIRDGLLAGTRDLWDLDLFRAQMG